jgi:hypothetical protein
MRSARGEATRSGVVESALCTPHVLLMVDPVQRRERSQWGRDAHRPAGTTLPGPSIADTHQARNPMHIREIPVIEYRRWLASLASAGENAASEGSTEGASRR